MGYAEIIAGVIGLIAAYLSYLKGSKKSTPNEKTALAANAALNSHIEKLNERIQKLTAENLTLKQSLADLLSDGDLLELVNRMHEDSNR